MLQCPSCQEKNRENARFCRYCGAELPQNTPESIAPQTEIQPPEPEVNSDTPPPEATEASSIHLGNTTSQKNAEDTDTGTTDENRPANAEAEERLAAAQPAQGTYPEPGDLIGERYRIVTRNTQKKPNGNEFAEYEAEDLLKCASCGHIQHIIGDQFCENCGALLEPHPVVQIRAIQHPEEASANNVPADTDSSEAESDSQDETILLIEQNIQYQVIPSHPAETPPAVPIFQLAFGYQSDKGETREIDEDSVLLLSTHGLSESGAIPPIGFFAVADGIGGHEAGEIASRIAIRSLAASITRDIFLPEFEGTALSPEERKGALKDAVQRANQAVLKARVETKTDMGCTLTAALVYGKQATIVNAGDSRTYHMRMGKLVQITEDHSVVAKMLSQEVIRPEEARTHDQAGVIYRSLGDSPDLEIDDAIYELPLEAGDRLLLCCDGLWEMVTDNIIEDTLLEYIHPQSACDKLTEMANLSGGEDNISVIVVNFQNMRRFH